LESLHFSKFEEDYTLYFLHIPKTAGTTLIKILDGYFDKNSICFHRTWTHLLQDMPDDFSRFRLIRGHFAYGISNILPKKPIYMTMLRNPITRTISWYEHILRETKERIKPIIDIYSEQPNLLELLDDPKKQRTFINTQVRHIALDLDVVDITKSFSTEQVNDYRFVHSEPMLSPTLSDEKLFGIAKNRLSDFAFFGLTEKFEESLMLMYYTFGWKPIDTKHKENVFPEIIPRENIPEKLLNKIRKLTQWDSQLYNFAELLFNKQFFKMVNDLKIQYYTSDLSNLPFNALIYELLERHHKRIEY